VASSGPPGGRSFTQPTLSAGLDPGSFRDRHSRVYLSGTRVLRGLSSEALAAWHLLGSSGLLEALTSTGRLVATRELGSGEIPPALREAGWQGVLDHQRIPFVSYPYEWSFEMLRDAALLQLDVLRESLARGLTMKDATPYNVQLVGAAPVFIDVGSFGPYPSGESWLGYRQFCELFLNPLLLHAYRGAPLRQLLRGRLDGIPPADCLAALSWRDRLRPGVLTHVLLHAKAEARVSSECNVTAPLAAAGFDKEMILNNLRGLSRVIRGLRPKDGKSLWVNYQEDNSYETADRHLKIEVVRREAAKVAGGLVWDLGANTGEYSRVAAEHATYVVAMDSDAACVDRLYLELKGESERRILPLVVDLADPSPGLGWRCAERAPLWDRGRPDLVLALALVHHLAIGANVPVPEIISWFAALGAGRLLVEYVAKDDAMTRRLLANKQDQYADYEQAAFEESLERHFVVEEKVALPRGTRWLYACRSRDAQARA